MAALGISMGPLNLSAGASQTSRNFLSVLLPRRHSTPVRHWKKTARMRALGERGRARGVQNDESSSQVEEVESTSPATPLSSSSFDKKAAARAEIRKGQTTAIITGAISVLLGVGYLVLIQLLDTRGVTLAPPPPEAFGP